MTPRRVHHSDFDHTCDYLSDRLENVREAMVEAIRDIERDRESERIAWEDELSEMAERANRAESALCEVLDRLDDWHRGLCDRDEIVTGKMIRELVTDRFAHKSINQLVRDWKEGN